jgi:MerR family transcriptional regulator, thiopeptide resistance regulator
MSTYRIKEFATLTGVSVRALHHYDRLGLLKPHRAQSGYRVYTADHVGIVEQIVALKFVGIPLGEIKELLRTQPGEWDKVLDAQHRLLEEKRRRLDLAIEAIREAQRTTGRDLNRVKRIIEVINMQEKRDEFKKAYEALVQGKVERLRALTPEARKELRGQFAALCKEIEGVLHDDPAGPRAQELAVRWLHLLGAFAPEQKVDPQLLKYAATYMSDGEWPAGAPRPEPPFGRALWEFMAKAIAARR